MKTRKKEEKDVDSFLSGEHSSSSNEVLDSQFSSHELVMAVDEQSGEQRLVSVSKEIGGEPVLVQQEDDVEGEEGPHFLVDGVQISQDQYFVGNQYMEQQDVKQYIDHQDVVTGDIMDVSGSVVEGEGGVMIMQTPGGADVVSSPDKTQIRHVVVEGGRIEASQEFQGVVGVDLYDDEDDGEFPDEIECQLIQKNVMMDGSIKTIDFIMCNQCPRLFRTETLLWNHIKTKHRRRSYYSRTPQARRRHRRGGISLNADGRPEMQQAAELEPGEIPTNKHLIAVGVGGPLQRERSDDTIRLERQKPKDMVEDEASKTGSYKCPGCETARFSSRRQLDAHMKKVHKAGCDECDECGKKVVDIKRHKDILHKRFKIFECNHCTDKFIGQDDLERHLMKVEQQNLVENKNNPEARNPSEQGPAAKRPKLDSDEDPDDPEKETDAEKERAFVSEVEYKEYKCTDCGMKTPSRMTYIQHVLNGCIMDNVPRLS